MPEGKAANNFVIFNPESYDKDFRGLLCVFYMFPLIIEQKVTIVIGKIIGRVNKTMTNINKKL